MSEWNSVAENGLINKWFISKGCTFALLLKSAFNRDTWRAKFLTWPWMFLSAQFLSVSIWLGIPTYRAELSWDNAVRGKYAVDQKERWHGWLSPTLLQRGRVRAGPLIKMSLLCRPCIAHTCKATGLQLQSILRKVACVRNQPRIIISSLTCRFLMSSLFIF